MASVSGAFSRLLNAFSVNTSAKCMASGRWYPQPENRCFSTSGGSSELENRSDDVISTPVNNIKLSRAAAAPVYYKPKRETPAYELVEHKNGELIGNYTLFEAAMEKTKVPWNDYSGLTSDERTIYLAHQKAINNKKLTYIDPFTKYTVFTIIHHLNKGKCCGNACRHCPYGHENAKEEVRSKKSWNGAYYV